ncbi:MAG: type II toxin-antitoxin system YoeB family toxin, partial [Anaerolineae bacterium]|nr:type II toxin-antitoxin system YoeB family toxin [Anaerolineae bacterium]
MHYALSMTQEFWNDLFNLPIATNKKARRVLGQMMQDPWSQQLHPEQVRQAENGVHSSRVDDNYRLIWKHIKPNHVVFCLVDKHDEAYRRARRKSFALKDGIVSVADIGEIGARAPSEQELFGWQRPKKDSVGVLFAGYRD